MTYTAKITDVQKVRHQARNKNFIQVECDILNEEGEIVESRKLGFDSSVTEEEIKSDVAKHAETYTLEKKQAIAQCELDKEDENIASIRKNLVGDQKSEPAEDNEKTS